MSTGTYRFPPMESVVYGRPFAEALKEQIEESGVNAVFVLASGTLNRDTDLVGQVRQALGNRLAGIFARIGAHTPRVDVVAAARGLQARQAVVHDLADGRIGRRGDAQHFLPLAALQQREHACPVLAVGDAPSAGTRSARWRSPGPWP